MNCERKTAYRTIQQAQRSANGRKRGGVPYLRVYQCRLCGMFHLTSERPRAGKAATAMLLLLGLLACVGCAYNEEAALDMARSIDAWTSNEIDKQNERSQSMQMFHINRNLSELNR